MINWKPWIPAIIWMACIFVFSTDLFSAPHTASIVEKVVHFLFPSLSPEQVQRIHFFIRKMGHVASYTLLGLFYARGVTKAWTQTWNFKWGGIILAMVFLYACTDEWHQSFSSARTASFGDVLYDSLGGLLSQVICRTKQLFAPVT